MRSIGNPPRLPNPESDNANFSISYREYNRGFAACQVRKHISKPSMLLHVSPPRLADDLSEGSGIGGLHRLGPLYVVRHHVVVCRVLAINVDVDAVRPFGLAIPLTNADATRVGGAARRNQFAHPLLRESLRDGNVCAVGIVLNPSAIEEDAIANPNCRDRWLTWRRCFNDFASRLFR